MITVTLFSTNDSQRASVTINPGDNWGALKEKISSETSISTSHMKAMVRETRNTLEDNQAELPTSNFTLILTPGRVKSGFKS